MELVLYPLLVLSALFFSGLRALSNLPDIDGSEIRYRDRNASGVNSKFRLCGAAFTLDVIVTQHQLILRTAPFFAGIALVIDLLQCIPLERVVGVKSGRVWTVVDFETENGKKKRVFLWLKNQKEFINLLKSVDEKGQSP